jgi:hypothetical protein
MDDVERVVAALLGECPTCGRMPDCACAICRIAVWVGDSNGSEAKLTRCLTCHWPPFSSNATTQHNKEPLDGVVRTYYGTERKPT